ncbi:MAG TPA: DUF459 domain-containing protein [Candidatus Dojkabacteria bacterium]|nr:DUF459 domain-containing protein [Candidatus Dojkabacteria bacterium]
MTIKRNRLSLLLIFSVIFSVIFFTFSSSIIYAQEAETPENQTPEENPSEPPDNRLQPPLKILLIGDSLINEGFGPQFEKKIKTFEGITIVRKGRYSTGLNRIDYFDWYAYTQQLINAEKPDILIIMIGANDGQGIVDDDGKVYALSDTENWNMAYTKRVNRFLNENRGSVKYIFWVGHPIPRTSDFYNKFIRMNSIYSSQCSQYSNTIYINSWNRFAINGKFSEYVTDNNGVSGIVKGSDGVHLTNHGGNILSDLVIDYLNQKINFGEPKAIVIQPTPKPVVIIPKAPVSKAKIPDIFIQEGSNTTNLSNLTLENSKAVKDLTLEILNVGSIQFTEDIDLSANELKDSFSQLDKFIKINQGEVEVDTAQLPQLNKPAKITIHNINLLETPVILKDGNLDEGNVSNIILENQTLSFNVTGFSRYTIKPSIGLTALPITKDQEVTTINGVTSDPNSLIIAKLPHNIAITVEKIESDGSFSVEVPIIGDKTTYSFEVTFFNGLTETHTIEVIRPNGNKDILPISQKGNSLVLYIVITIIALLLTATTIILVKKYKTKKALITNETF